MDRTKVRRIILYLDPEMVRAVEARYGSLGDYEAYLYDSLVRMMPEAK